MGWKNVLESFILNFHSNGKTGYKRIHIYQEKTKYPKRLRKAMKRTLEKASEDSVLILNMYHLPMCP